MKPANPLLSDADWSRLQELFDEASQLPSTARSAFLDEQCETHLRTQVDSLLRSLDGDTVFEPAVREAVEMAAIAIGERIGPYEVIRVLGRGGMGVVYLAKRADDEFQKLVALKLLPIAGLDPETRRRFLLERQILARLEHPNIARLLDGGTVSGAPYVVMEYVDGAPIDRYCRAENLGVQQRLRLLLQLNDAVGYAHRNLIVHRDLKPGNVLVSSGVPKLLDFGIAKLLQSDAYPESPLTQMGDRLMTPDYASPEQVRGETITTASDIYSLGVLLYELLTEKRPFHAKAGRPAELEHAILTEEPPKPSTVAGHKELRGDLDNIVLMALRKEPARRYASVEQFSEDIRRHLDGFPVSALKDTWSYRAGKFVRRHKLAVATACLVSLAILGFGAGMAALAKRAATERDTARAERTRAEQVSTLLLDTFRVSDPSLGDGSRVTAREILDRGALNIDKQNMDPATRADLLDTLGLVYENLGVFDRSREQMESARDLRLKLYGDRSPQYALSLEHLGMLEQDKGAWTGAEKLLRQAIQLRAGKIELAQPRAEALKNLATVLRKLGRYPQAEEAAKEALTILRQSSSNQPAEIGDAEYALGYVYFDQGKNAEADTLVRDALALKVKALGEDNTQVAELVDVMGQIQLTSGDYPQGIEYFKRSLQLYSKLLGADSRPVGELQNNLGVAYAWVGDLAMAVAMQKQAVATYRKVFGETHQEIVGLLYNLTVNLHSLGSHEEEGSVQHELARIAAEMQGLADRQLLSVKQSGYGVLYDRGQYQLAEQGIRDAIEQRRRIGDSPRFLAGTYSTLGDALASQGRLAEAVEAYQTGANLFHEKDQATNQAARINERLGYGLALQGRNAQAREVLQKSISGFRSRGPLYPQLASALLTMGQMEMAEHHRAEASQLMEQALAIRKKVLIPGAWEITVAESMLARSRDDVSGAPALTSALERCAPRSYDCQTELARLRAVLGQRRQ